MQQFEQISHYRVERLIGAGGMGEVYLAHDERLGRKVALKLLPARFTMDEERVRRFQREARAASALNHPNIITIYDIGSEGGVHYIATEYIDGETLREFVSRRQMSIGSVLDVGTGAASALAAAHEAGIIHRDIKPENIMVRHDGYVKVLDFGLAKLIDDAALKDSGAGAVMGTLLYLSPEQARGQSPDARADLYSLGAVLYEMITGRSPINGESFLDMAWAIAHQRIEPPSHFVAGIPPELDRIVIKALEKDRQNRYSSARQMLGDLLALRKELEFEDKLHMLDPHRSKSVIGQQPTLPMTFPPSSTSSRFVKMASVIAQSRAMAFGVAALALITLLLFVMPRTRLFGGGSAIDSVAVLPFTNLSGNPNSEYLSDGLSESVIDNLSQLPGLQVVARSTVFRYKGKGSDPLAVGRELNVRGVVTGQLMLRGDTLVIRASLTDVKKGTQIWGQQYDRRMSDVLGVQRELSEEISNQLRTRLSGEEQKRLTRLNAGTNEAYQLYLKGHYFTSKYNNEEAIKRGIGLLNQAIEKDPTYALAYTGLSDAYYNLSNLYLPPNQAMPRARQAAERALQLDDSLAQAHVSLAMVKIWYEWDFRGGEREFRRGIDLNPNDSDAHRRYGDFLTVSEQFDRALAEKRKAEQLDPLSVTASYETARTLFFARRYGEALEQLKRTLDLDEHFAYAHYFEAQIAMQQGRVDDGLQLLQTTMQMAGRTPLLVAMWGYANARAGHKAEAESAIHDLESRSGNYSALFLARIHAALGDNDEAIRLLQQVYDDRSESIVWLKVDSTFDSLRKDARFVELLRKVGL